jgi:hypothetical protein
MQLAEVCVTFLAAAETRSCRVSSFNPILLALDQRNTQQPLNVQTR